MPWFRLDDSFHSHPKVIAAGNEAVGLYVRCGTYAAQHLTDGFVGKSIVLLYGSEALAARLVETGLWNRTRGGWNIHDYLDYNPSRETVEKERKAAAERQRRKRSRDLSETGPQSGRDLDFAGTLPSKTDVDNREARAVAPYNSSSGYVTSRRDSRSDTAVSHTTPTRPDPYISGTGLSSANGRAYPQAQPPRNSPSSQPAREATRLPPGYRPASPDAAHAAAAAAREALAAKRKPP